MQGGDMVSSKASYLFEDYFNYKFPQPQYLGAKFKHLSWIYKYIPDNIHTVLDAFSGSQSVAFYFKQKGYRVYTNDFLNFNHHIGMGLVENNHQRLDENDIDILFSDNQNHEHYNLMDRLFTGIFFTQQESRFLDSFRSNIDCLENDYKKSLAFAIINRSMTRKVTMGHFAHNKALDYANNPERVKRNRSLVRPLRDIFLDLLPQYNEAIFDNHQGNKSFNQDAISLIHHLKDEIDLLYLDPPYCGSHADYQSFYHLLETYSRYWKNKEFKNANNRYFPKIYSGFETKQEIMSSFENLFEKSKNIPYWMISYNDRSYPAQDDMISLIKKYKNVELHKKEYSNDVGGKGSVQGSHELLFMCF